MTEFEAALDETLRYLRSADASASVRRDPYWPKWSSPWWRMTLLWELGLARLIPAKIVAVMTEAVGRHYLPFFPVDGKPLPPGKDGRLHVLCPCAIGTIHQVLCACGVPLDAELPWLKRTLLDSQLPDGGLNCDETAYLGSRKSSMLSTVAALEAVLPVARTDEERRFIERGEAYLVAHKLVRSTSGELIDPDWLKPCFPRFYHYDVLRGAAWLRRRGVVLDGLALPPSVVGRYALEPHSLVEDRGAWSRGPASTFPLLELVSRPGQPIPG